MEYIKNMEFRKKIDYFRNRIPTDQTKPSEEAFKDLLFHLHSHDLKKFAECFDAMKINVNIQFYENKTTLLHEALSSTNCCERILKYLFNKGADINLLNHNMYNETPFHKFLSCDISKFSQRCVHIFRMLLMNGADIELRGGKDCLKPFEYCLTFKRDSYIQELLKLNVDVQFANEDGNIWVCYLHFYSAPHDLRIDLLQRCYINLETLNNNGESLVDIFIRENNHHMLNLILKFDIKFDYRNSRFMHYLIYLKKRLPSEVPKILYEIMKRNPGFYDEMMRNTNYVNVFGSYLVELKLMRVTFISTSTETKKQQNMTYFQFLSTSLLSPKIQHIKQNKLLQYVDASRAFILQKFPLFTNVIFEKKKTIFDRITLFEILDRCIKLNLGKNWDKSIYLKAEYKDVKFRIFSSFFGNSSCVSPET